MSFTVHDCYRLGFGEPVAVSATSGEGMVDLYQAVRPWVESADALNMGKVTHLAAFEHETPSSPTESEDTRKCS
jgi:predicted GTPase